MQDKKTQLSSPNTLSTLETQVTSGSSHALTQGILPSSRVPSICTSRALRLLRFLDASASLAPPSSYATLAAKARSEERRSRGRVD